VARGAEQVAYAEDYNVFLCNTEEDPQRELEVLASLEEKRVDGVVLCSSRLDDDKLGQVIARHPAVVLVNRRLGSQGDNVSTVLVDDLLGGRMITQHLLDRGHHTIGFLAGPSGSRSGRQRLQGYRAALTLAGFSPNPAWVCNCSPTVEGGQDATRELLSAISQLTAVFCYNDLVAIGALQACAELARRVPDDLAVVGFDDIPLAALVTPSLTTCRVPRYELGVQAVRLLLDQISDCPKGCATQVVLQPELVIRASAP
jgi:LacI family transcriptional regulator